MCGEVSHTQTITLPHKMAKTASDLTYSDSESDSDVIEVTPVFLVDQDCAQTIRTKRQRTCGGCIGFSCRNALNNSAPSTASTSAAAVARVSSAGASPATAAVATAWVLESVMEAPPPPPAAPTPDTDTDTDDVWEPVLPRDTEDN